MRLEPENIYDPSILEKINELILLAGENPDTFESDLVKQIIQTSLKLLTQQHDTAQLKLITATIKEMRYAYGIFNKYKGSPCISFFGSARTPPEHPDYIAARHFGRTMAEHGWMVITGGGEGLMRAGLEEIPPDARIGLSIRLPFEENASPAFAGDPKLITFRYFFTRKVMFLTHSNAIAVFPGGVGTHDELFEALTLLQTGKAEMVPLVLLEGEGGDYWKNWWHYFEKNLIDRGMVSREDRSFFYIAPSVAKAVEHIQHFYLRYHSSRYVKDTMVIRMLQPLSPDQIETLNERYSAVIKSGMITPSSALPEENDHLDLPRIIFHHTRSRYGIIRELIDTINSFPLG